MLRWGSVGFLFVALASLASSASAQSSALTRGIERFDEADFAGAVAAFDEAETGEGLSRADLVDLYGRRASAHLAIGDRAAMQRDLSRLASLEPEHTFGPETRPEVRQAFETIRAEREPISVSIEHTVEAGAIRFVASVDADPDGLARRVEVRARARGGEWMSGNGSVVVPVVEGAVVQHYATVIGPGGAPIATAGTQDEPLAVTHDGVRVEDPGPDGPPITDDGDDTTVVWVIGGIVVAALVIGAVLLIATSGGNDATQPDPPMIFPSM